MLKRKGGFWEYKYVFDSIPHGMKTITELIVLLVPQCAKSLHPSIMFAAELMPFLRAGLFVSLHHKKEEFRLKSLYCMLPEINSLKMQP